MAGTFFRYCPPSCLTMMAGVGVAHTLLKVNYQLIQIFDIGTGHDFKIAKQQNRTTQRANVFSQRVINPWNPLPKERVNSDSLNKFNSSLNEV